MKVIDLPYKHIKKFGFLPIVEYQKLVSSLPFLKWELYDKGHYKYKVSGIDYETEYYKKNKDIVEKFVSVKFIENCLSFLTFG